MVQSFHRANLRGRSFKGQDLTAVDFSYADIRGADFTNTLLIGANFSHAKAGLRQRQVIFLTAIALALSILAGFMTGYGGGLIGSFMAMGDRVNPYAGFSAVVALTILGTFAAFTLRKGLTSAGTAVVVIAVLATLGAAIASEKVAVVILVQTIGIAGAVAGVIVEALAVVLSLILLGKTALAIATVLAVLGAAIGTQFGIAGIELGQTFVLASAIAGAVALVMLWLGGYVGRLAWKGSSSYALIRSLAIALSTRGTSFRGATLTDANLTGARLKNTDFRGAVLTRTCWFQAQQLDQSRLEGTYLEDSRIQQLAVTRAGQEQNFDNYNLRGLNLQNADLVDISLVGADLSEATLQAADLSRAKLVQTQLYRADLTRACLTGAYIQDWGISADTRMDEVRCEYVYMRLPTKADPDPCRKPDNRQEVFKEGDFADFMAPILRTLELYRQQNVDPRAIAHTFKTLDLYHHKGIDPTAAAIALKQLSEQYPEAGLEVVALEGRGRDKIRLQAVVTDAVDRSQLSAQYFATYDEIKDLPSPDLQSLLTEIAQKDERIRSLEQMVTTAIQSNKFYVETYYDLGDTMSENRSININSGGGNVSGVVGGNVQDVGGDINFGAINDSRTPPTTENSESNSHQSQPRESVLAVIVFTDVAGSTERMAINQTQMVALLDRDFEIMRTTCQRYEGRVLKSMGDGLLMYFNSATKAVTCAQEIQQVLLPNDNLLSHLALRHRIGIHLGEVFFDGDDVLGIGVNVAARLQSIADPGSICISQTVFEVVKNQLPLTINSLGTRTLKGIPEAIMVYAIVI